MASSFFVHNNEASERRDHMPKKSQLSPEQRYSMTIEEAAGYSLIGEGRLRKIIEEDRTLEWVLRVGSQVRIKRVLFEKWLDRVYNL